MKSLPEIGLYISTNKEKPLRICVTDAFGDEPEEFYIVETVNEADKDAFPAMGAELDKEQWESLVKECGLAFQG